MEKLRSMIINQKTAGQALRSAKDTLYIQRNWLFSNTNKETEKYKSKLFRMISTTKKAIRWSSRTKIVYSNNDLLNDTF